MIDATKWHAKGILTDHTAKLLELRKEMKSRHIPSRCLYLVLTLWPFTDDWPAVSAETTGRFPWYTPLLNVRPGLRRSRNPY